MNTEALARRIIENRRELHRERFARRKDELFALYPRLREIEAGFDGTGMALVRRVAEGDCDSETAVREIMEENRRAAAERAKILTSAGYPADYLDDKPDCPLCGDTGRRGGELCSCVRSQLDRELSTQANLSEKLTSQTFEGFRLDCYSDEPDPGLGISPRENMRSIYNICRSFADNFATADENLFFTGGCGLGKTYLSSAIANALIAKGEDVLYVSANSLFPILEDLHFNRDVSEKNRYLVEKVFGSALLILDDLGAEFVTPFTSAELFRIVNNRLLEGKRTIISTNLSIDETERRYSPRLYSRLTGGYTILKFFGEDIRWKLKNRRGEQ